MALIKSWAGQAQTRYTKYTGVRRYRYANTPGVFKTQTHLQVIRVVGDIELSIDVQALLEKLGAKALLSKSGRSNMMGGIVKAKVTKRAEHPGELKELGRSKHEIDVPDEEVKA